MKLLVNYIEFITENFNKSNLCFRKSLIENIFWIFSSIIIIIIIIIIKVLALMHPHYLHYWRDFFFLRDI